MKLYNKVRENGDRVMGIPAEMAAGGRNCPTFEDTDVTFRLFGIMNEKRETR